MLIRYLADAPPIPNVPRLCIAGFREATAPWASARLAITRVHRLVLAAVDADIFPERSRLDGSRAPGPGSARHGALLIVTRLGFRRLRRGCSLPVSLREL